MKKIYLQLILSLFLCFNLLAHAGEVSVEDFAQDLDQMLGLDQKRTVEVANSAHLFLQLNPFASTAEASYIPLLKTIFLKMENLNIDSCEHFLPSLKIKSIRQLKLELPLTYSIKVATIFHELGHAEMAEHILKGVDEDDQALLDLYLKEFKPWAQKNFPDVNPKDLFHEYYGYFRTNIIETLFKDMLEIESFNGFNRFRPACSSMNY